MTRATTASKILWLSMWLYLWPLGRRLSTVSTSTSLQMAILSGFQLRGLNFLCCADWLAESSGFEPIYSFWRYSKTPSAETLSLPRLAADNVRICPSSQNHF
jgi:hypothetical protein